VADNLTDVSEQGLLNHLTGAATFTVVLPLKLALHSANGTDTATGTEVTGGAGPYARTTIVFNPASATGVIANSNVVSFPGMPAVTVNAFSVWDSSATPQRLFYGPTTTNRTLVAGDTYEVAAGAITLSLA
jgi:hypothetical protein